MSNTSAIALIEQLKVNKSLVIKGFEEIGTVRAAIGLATREAGLQLSFDPESDSGLMIYLASASPQGGESVLGGALLGSLLGLAFDRPGLGATFGARLGAAGASKGRNLGAQGWRIRAVHDKNGAPVITINAELVS